MTALRLEMEVRRCVAIRWLGPLVTASKHDGMIHTITVWGGLGPRVLWVAHDGAFTVAGGRRYLFSVESPDALRPPGPTGTAHCVATNTRGLGQGPRAPAPREYLRGI